jgi:hypothetical protein
VIRAERSYNYKLRATLMTPEVIRATARLTQLSNGLTTDEAMALVREAEAAGHLVVLLEIDPREGSGVIPPDLILVVLLRPRDGDDDTAIRGTVAPKLREVRALAGAFRRDYVYEQVWAVFSLNGTRRRVDRSRRHPHRNRSSDRIHDKEGLVSWPMPPSLRAGRLQRRGGGMGGQPAAVHLWFRSLLRASASLSPRGSNNDSAAGA